MRSNRALSRPLQNERGGALGWILLLTIVGSVVIVLSVVAPPYFQNFKVREIVKDMAMRSQKIRNDDQLWREIDRRIRALSFDGMVLDGEYGGQPNGVFVDPDRGAKTVTLGVAYDRVRILPGIGKEYRMHFEEFQTVPRF